MNTKRLHTLDVMRFLALVFMVLIHFVDNMTYWQQQNGPVYDLVEWVGIMSAPMFTFLVGSSFYLSASKRPASALTPYILRRGAAIFIFGLGHMLINWGASSLFDWDILTFIGSALILLLLVRRWSDAALLALMAAIWLGSPFLRLWSLYDTHWDFASSTYWHNWQPAEIFLGWLLNGTFPVLPWLIFPLGGYLAGRRLLRRSPSPYAAYGFLVLGMATASLGWWGSDFLGPIYGGEFTFYPAAPSYLLWMLGVDWAMLALLWLVLDAPTAPLRASWQKTPWHTISTLFSQHALSLYILHHSVHLWPIYLAGWLWTGDRWYFYADAMSLPTALTFAAFFGLAVWPLLRSWQLGNGYNLEWALRKIVRG